MTEEFRNFKTGSNFDRYKNIPCVVHTYAVYCVRQYDVTCHISFVCHVALWLFPVLGALDDIIFKIINATLSGNYLQFRYLSLKIQN